jgi:hypothetical protein
MIMSNHLCMVDSIYSIYIIRAQLASWRQHTLELQCVSGLAPASLLMSFACAGSFSDNGAFCGRINLHLSLLPGH